MLPLPLGGAPATTAGVPEGFDIALEGVGYMVDYSSGRYSDHSVSVLKPQSDQGAEVGAASLNPEGLWPVTLSEWHLGAGQDFFDKPDSDSRRFRQSKNIDIWTEGEIRQLKRTSVVPNANEFINQFLVTAGNRIYWTAASVAKTRVHFTDEEDLGNATYTGVTGFPTSDVKSIASDGHHVMVAYAGDGLYLTDASTTTMSSWITGMVDLVGYVKGRVMCASGQNLYNVTTAYEDTAALPTALFTHRSDSFKWVAFAEGEGFIYAAGVSGDKSEIYRIEVQPDGTALDTPVVAGRLPDGEVVHSIFGYLGFVLLGTSSGVRLAVEGDTGNLTIGALIETGSVCRDFAARGRFVYFTWEQYDSDSSGIGRIDLQNLTDPQALVPAFASDLMYDFNAGIVPSVAIYNGEVLFTLVGKGLMYEDPFGLYPLSADAGTIESGAITFNLAEPKIAVSVLVEASIPEADDEITVYLKADDGNYQTIGTVSVSGETVLSTNIEGSRLELKLEFDGGGDTTPAVSLVQLKVHPRIEGTEKIVLPIKLAPSVDDAAGGPEHYDVDAHLAQLKGWWKRQDLLDLTDADGSKTVVIEDYDWQPEAIATDSDHRGIYYAEFKVIDDRMDN